MNIALVGNPNSGKTTLFNELTGSSAKVGNWPGVTVDKKVGVYKKGKSTIDIVDLPGVYSLSPYTLEEVIARDYIIKEKIDVVVNIVDATNIERNLYLTTQLLETDIPVVIALNMMDLARKNKTEIDVDALSKKLGVPIICISALRSENIKELMNVVETTSKNRVPFSVLQTGTLKDKYESLLHLLKSANIKQPHFMAAKLLENDEKAYEEETIASLKDKISEIVSDDYEGEVANIRYEYLSAQLDGCISKPKQVSLNSTSDKIDKLLTSRYLGIPIFLGIMMLIFHLTFSENLFGLGMNSIGVYFQGLTEVPITWLSELLTQLLDSMQASTWVYGLVVDGVIGGVGAVLSFVPQILLIFFFLSLLEDSGYMARAAFLMDRILRRFGLSGKAFLPLLTGFGCSVPAIMGARTLETDQERKLTMILVPYMSCGAKAPIWALFAASVFKGHGDFLTFGIYLLGILVAVISAILMKKFVFKGDASAFVMELPAYHLPRARNLLLHLWDKLKGYVIRAGTIILAATIVLWFLANFNFSLQMVEANSNESIIGILASSLTFLFAPLGFVGGSNGWKAVVAILTGLIAKEAVVSTLGQLYTGMESENDFMGEDSASGALYTTLALSFSPLAALSFMAFNLLSVPCMAAVGALKAEVNNRKIFWFAIAFWILSAWVVSFIIYNVGGLFF